MNEKAQQHRRIHCRGAFYALNCQTNKKSDLNKSLFGYSGGWGRNRTGVRGFAIRCMATLLPSQCELIKKAASLRLFWNLERETRLELATPTLARLCSTTELFPRCGGAF